MLLALWYCLTGRLQDPFFYQAFGPCEIDLVDCFGGGGQFLQYFGLNDSAPVSFSVR